MNWFDLAYFGPMMLLALWLAVGLYLSLRGRVLLGTEQRSGYNRADKISTRSEPPESNRGFEFTSSNVREAFELFLNNFESGRTNQNR
ncbi:MAG: hypothetical protein LC731_02040 [Acidobacteria bacterium]|nr:hypothetical protein [Acidobacteriota bacterium]